MTKHNSTKSESTKTKKTGSELSSLAHAILKFTDAYVQANRIRKIPFYKSKVLWSGIGVVVAVSGYLINAHAQTKQIEATRLQKEIELKVDHLGKINAALANARIVLLNDAEKCKNPNTSKAQWPIDRNNAIEDVLNQASGIEYIFDPYTKKTITTFINRYNSIKSICRLDDSKEDKKFYSMLTKIDNRIGNDIQKDRTRLKDLTD